MSLELNIQESMKDAMKSQDKKSLLVLKDIKAAILKEKTSGQNIEIDQDKEIEILTKLLKQRLDSAKIFSAQNRVDLAEDEEFQASIIKRFLPEQLSDEAINNEVQLTIQELGVSNISEMGKVMAILNQKLKGKANNAVVSKYVRENLS